MSKIIETKIEDLEKELNYLDEIEKEEEETLKRRKKLIIEKLTAINGRKPTAEEIEKDLEFLNNCLTKIKTRI